MYFEVMESFGLILSDVHSCKCCTIFWNVFIWNDVGYLVLLDICLYKLFGLLSKILASLMRNYFPKRPSGAPLHTLSKLYDVPVGFVTPPPLFWGWILLILRSPKGGCCSISDDLSCSSNQTPEDSLWLKILFGCTNWEMPLRRLLIISTSIIHFRFEINFFSCHLGNEKTVATCESCEARSTF